MKNNTLPEKLTYLKVKRGGRRTTTHGCKILRFSPGSLGSRIIILVAVEIVERPPCECIFAEI